MDYNQLAALCKHGFLLKHTEAGTDLYTAAALAGMPGMIHGFSTRRGGVSAGPYAALNLSWGRNASRQETVENYHIFARGAGVPYESMALVNHEHGDTILRLNAADCGRGFSREALPLCDGLITNDSGVTLVTAHADCCAYFLYDPVTHCTGLAHAGWKGTLSRIGGKTVARMQEAFGADPKNLMVAVGPCICKKCFEVDDELAKKFVREFDFTGLREKGGPGKSFVDLEMAAAIQFLDAGVLPSNMTLMHACTYESPNVFFSHRRDKGLTGSMAAFIKIVPLLPVLLQDNPFAAGETEYICEQKGFFMEIYVVIAVCAIIALCTSERANVVAALGVDRFFAIFVLLCVFCISRFEIKIIPELRLNLGLFVIPLATMKFRSHAGQWLAMWSCVLIFAVLSFLVERLGWLYGTQNGLLCGMLSGAAIILLDENDYTAFLGISLVPLVKTIFDMIYDMYSMGYGALDFSSSALLNAQILAVTTAAFLVFIRKSKREPAKN